MIRSIKSLAGLALLSFAAINIYAQGNATSKTAGVGIPFGSRDPRPCADLTGSVLTQQKALSLFICSDEQLGQIYLNLIENASLQLGNPRAYNFKEDYNLPNIDLAAKVYPIRGSFREYSCVRFSDYMQNRGRNCTVKDHPNATGLCYKDSWGSWRCSIGDVSFKMNDTQAAPPGGAAAPVPPQAARQYRHIAEGVTRRKRERRGL